MKRMQTGVEGRGEAERKANSRRVETRGSTGVLILRMAGPPVPVAEIDVSADSCCHPRSRNCRMTEAPSARMPARKFESDIVGAMSNTKNLK